jgi:hypothetical protein
MAEPTYRWQYPGEWLLHRIRISAQAKDVEALAWYATELTGACDSDTLQDLFQDEMDADGYFKPLRPRTPKREED